MSLVSFAGYADSRCVRGGASAPKSRSGCFGVAPVLCGHRTTSTIAVPQRSDAVTRTPVMRCRCTSS